MFSPAPLAVPAAAAAAAHGTSADVCPVCFGEFLDGEEVHEGLCFHKTHRYCYDESLKACLTAERT